MLLDKRYKRNKKAYSLIETMMVIAVIGIVLGILFAYQDQGWKLFYQSYGRGLSLLKAKIAIRLISEELIEANKDRIAINSGTSYGVPLPDDYENNFPYIYFTKPIIYESTGDVISYDYVLYYFARPKEKLENIMDKTTKGGGRSRVKEKEKFVTLKSVKFLKQSKFYTEDREKNWPFLPPLLELQKSTLPEDESFIESIKSTSTIETGESPTLSLEIEQEQFLDHFAKLKKESRNVPLSGNFLASSLTNPFSTQEVNIFFGQDYKSSKPIKIKVSIDEPATLLSLMSAMTEFEVIVTPRN